MTGVVSPFNQQVDKSFQSSTQPNRTVPGATGRSATIGAIRDKHNKTSNTMGSNGMNTKRSVGRKYKMKIESIKTEIDDLYQQSINEFDDMRFASIDIEDTTEAETMR